MSRLRWIALTAALAAAGCGEGRHSAEGESCGRTADCAEPLRCVDRACLTPARARHLLEARSGPAVPDGAEPAASGLGAPLGRGLGDAPSAPPARSAEAPADAPAPDAAPSDAPGGGGRP